MNITLTTPAQVLAAIPALLGFVPTESLVVIATRDGSVSVTMRVDLAKGLVPVDHMTAALQESHTDSVRIVVVTCTAEPADRHPVIEEISAAVRACRIPVLAQIQVQTVGTGGAVWVDHSTHLTGVTLDYRDSALSAAQVVAGRSIDHDRSSLAARFARHPDRQANPVADPHTVSAGDTVRGIIAAMHDPRTIDEDLAAATAAVIAQGKGRRDALLRTVIYDADQAAAVFTQCAAQLSGRARADLLTLAAVGYYFAGHGAHVNAAIQAAHDETSQVDSLLTLIEQMIRTGGHPKVVRESLSSLTGHDRASELLGEDYPPYE